MNDTPEPIRVEFPDISERPEEQAERHVAEKAERERRIAIYRELAEQRKPLGLPNGRPGR